MESIIVWGIAFILVIVFFVPAMLKFRRIKKHDLARRQEAIRLGADKPIAQYPQIDEMLCIGCGSCVAACPEGDVLGIVAGRSVVINGLKCVGHGLCGEACPVGAIKVGLGDVKSRDDIPVMNEYYETNLPRIYIAGELGGLALIKHAIAQGRKVMERIAEINSSTQLANGGSQNTGVFDVMIVGAGPAGISAALTAIQNKLSYLLIDQQGFGGTILQYPRKKLVMTKPIEIPSYGWLNKPEYEKEELLAIWNTIHQEKNLNINIGERLVGVERHNGTYWINTQNRMYLSRYVVLALGRRGTPRKLNVPGEETAKVMYKLIDAESYQNNQILVVGGGDSAVEAAIGLSMQPGNNVILSYRKAKFFRIKKKNEERINEAIQNGKVTAIFNSQVDEILKESVILRTDKESQKIPNDYVFIFAGGEPPFKLLRDIGIAFGGKVKKEAAIDSYSIR